MVLLLSRQRGCLVVEGVWIVCVTGDGCIGCVFFAFEGGFGFGVGFGVFVCCLFCGWLVV